MSQLRAPATRADRREGGRHGRPPARTAPALPETHIRPQLLRLAVLPPVAVSLSACAAVLFVVRSTGARPGATLWAVLTGAASVAAAAVLIAAVAANRTAGSVTERVGALRRSSARGEADLRALVETLRRGDGPPKRKPRGGPPDGADDFELLAADLARARDGAVTAVVQAAQLSSQAGSEQKLEVFVNLARRLQSLVHREISILDELENEIEDPDLLKGLFHVDHLATRIRRHAENLAVLGGAVSRRQWSNPVSMTEVLRSAIAEVEQYSRVKLVPPVDGTLRGHAVADVIHLLAELVENATVFSAPHTQVLLRANLVTSGLAVEVEDRGLGMPVGEQNRMNALLADPDQVNVASLLADGRIGLFVVSQLAKRHGIHVRLQTNIYGGVQAVLVVPQGLLGTDPEAHAAAVRAREPRGGDGGRGASGTRGGAVAPGASSTPSGLGAPGGSDAPGASGTPGAPGAPGGGLPSRPRGQALPQQQQQQQQQEQEQGQQRRLQQQPQPPVVSRPPQRHRKPPSGSAEGGRRQAAGGGQNAPRPPQAQAAGPAAIPQANGGGPAPLPVRGSHQERANPAEARPGIKPDDRRFLAENAGAPPVPRTGPVRGTMGKPQLPRRRAQEHIAPQLRDGPVARQESDQLAGHDPGLMAAFQRGVGLAETQQHMEQQHTEMGQRHTEVGQRHTEVGQQHTESGQTGSTSVGSMSVGSPQMGLPPAGSGLAGPGGVGSPHQGGDYMGSEHMGADRDHMGAGPASADPTGGSGHMAVDHVGANHTAREHTAASHPTAPDANAEHMGAVTTGADHMGPRETGATHTGAHHTGVHHTGVHHPGSLHLTGKDHTDPHTGITPTDPAGSSRTSTAATPLSATPLNATSLNATSLNATPLDAMSLDAAAMGAHPTAASPTAASPIGAPPMGPPSMGVPAMDPAPMAENNPGRVSGTDHTPWPDGSAPAG